MIPPLAPLLEPPLTDEQKAWLKARDHNLNGHKPWVAIYEVSRANDNMVCVSFIFEADDDKAALTEAWRRCPDGMFLMSFSREMNTGDVFE